MAGTTETQRRDYFRAAGVVATSALLGWAAHAAHLADVNIVMIFLAGVAFVAARMGRWPSIAAAVVSVLLFDFFFVPPRLTFAVSDTQYLITFLVMLGIGLLISELTSRLQAQLGESQEQVKRTAQLYRMTRQLSELSGSDFLVRTAARQLEEIFDGEVVLYLRESGDDISLRFGERSSIVDHSVNEVVAQWVATNGRTAGANTDTLPNATALFVPLAGSQQVLGSLGIAPHEQNRFLDPEQIRLLETCGSLIALSLERDKSVLKAHEAELQVKTEQLRNSLLSSVSHDLRTPLATIAGTASGLLEMAPRTDHDSLQTIVDESHRLTRLVENLLDMARLDSGSLTLNRQWHVLEEIVGVALNSAKRELQNHKVCVTIPADFPLLNIDGFLTEQVLVNLLENASRYTPAGSVIDITATAKERMAEIRVSDNGPGLPPGSENKVFDKFFRGATVSPDGRRGVGLGLAICRAIVDAHLGTIAAANRREGGAEFTITLPCNETPPRVEAEIAAVTREHEMAATLPRVLLVEDELPIRKFVRTALTGAEYQVDEAGTAQQALQHAAQAPPDLVILDLGLPDMDGQQVIQQLREWLTAPIIVLSARDQDQEKILALDNGADDYLTKPFSTGELLARIRVALRHANRVNDDGASMTFEIGELKVDLAARRVYVSGREVHLTPIEYKLLTTLIHHAGKVLTHRQLLKEVWGPDQVQDTHYLRVFMATLRRKLENDPARPRFLLTEQGVGYRLAGE